MRPRKVPAALNKFTTDKPSPPNYRVIRCCRNCLFFKAKGTGERGRANGFCHVYDEVQPGRSIATHATLLCDAHIWKEATRPVNNMIIKYGAELPNEEL